MLAQHQLCKLLHSAGRLGSSRSLSSLGFIGLGNMGGFMAINLAKAGHRVKVFDIRAEVADEVVANSSGNAIVASSALAAITDASTVVTMLPSSSEVQQLFLGDSGLLQAAAGRGKLFIDSTTGNPSACVTVAEAAEAVGCSYIDAPVSGGVVAAKSAQLTFMCGGSEKDFEVAKPLLACMGKTAIHCGSNVGSGCAAKICNNMLLAISMLGTCEAMHLGQQLGLDAAKLAEVLNSSSGRCWSSEIYNPVPGLIPGLPASRDYTGGFHCSLMLKDLRLALESASSCSSSAPMGALAQQLYSVLCAQGFAQRDFSVFYRFLQRDQAAVAGDK